MILQSQNNDFTSVSTTKKRIYTKPIDKVGKEFYNSFNQSYITDYEIERNDKYEHISKGKSLSTGELSNVAML